MGSSDLNGSFVGECPTVRVEIAGKEAICLLDTGSMVTTLSESFYLKYLSDIPIIKENFITLRAANGLGIPYTGYIKTDVYIKSIDKKLEDRGILISTEMPDSTIQGILGMNVIKMCHEILLANHGPSYDKKMKGDHAAQNLIKATKSCNATEVKGFVRVAGRDQICIPGNSASVVNVVGPSAKQGCVDDSFVCIEPLANEQNFVLLNTVAESRAGCFPVLVANLTQRDVWIRPKTRVGLVSAL